MSKKLYKWLKVIAVFSLIANGLLGLINFPTVSAAEVTQYTSTTTISANGTPLDSTTGTTVVKAYQKLETNMSFEFPDSQVINSGDTMTITIPQELRFSGAIADFDVKNEAGTVVGRAKVDTTTNTVTVTFTDQFEKVPENKQMQLTFNLIANENKLTTNDVVTTTLNEKPISFTFQKDEGVGIDGYTFKYSYPDSTNPDIIHWVAIINANQDPIRNMVITDKLDAGHTFVTNTDTKRTFRVYRLEIKENDPVDSEAEAKSRQIIDNHWAEVVFNDEKTEFTFTDTKNRINTINGKDYGFAYYILYETRVDRAITNGQTTFKNTISVKGSNMESRSRTASYTDQNATGSASSQKSENVVLKTKKEVTGPEASLAEGQFSFSLYNAEDLNTPLQTKTNAADGTVTFDAIKYSQAGTVNYVIKENIPAEADRVKGYTYDTGEVTATVTVTKEANGVYMGSVVYGEKTRFTNTYAATTEVSGQKTWANDTPSLRPTTVTVQLLADGVAVEGKTATTDAQGNYSFQDLPKYTTDGTAIVYTVEEISVPAGYVATYSGYNITNTYQPTPATAQIAAAKVLTGRTLQAGEFAFTLTDQNGQAVETVSNNAEGQIAFKELTFDKAGTYTYTIAEKAGKLAGVQYDTKPITATVTVTDKGAGVLEAIVTYDKDGKKDTTFTNHYSAGKATATLEATKTLTGRALAADEFEFVLKDQEGKKVETVKNTADGKITFATLTFEKVGTYTYTISEKEGTLGGITYDPTTVKATVTVTDNGKGQLEAAVSYENKDKTFENSYKPAPTTAQITATKALTGRALKKGEFEFTLTDQNGQEVETVANTADGNIIFKKLSFTAAGTYTYTIAEKAGNLGGVSYDTTVVKAIVTVTDNGNGQLQATIAYENEDKTFENAYTPGVATATLKATKTLTGRSLRAGEFSFVLKNQAGQEIETATNLADGSITFKTLSFEKEGTYTYTISEKAGKLDGITYDTSLVTATVTVTDNGNGQLEAIVAYANEDKTFENSYTPPTPSSSSSSSSTTSSTEPLGSTPSSSTGTKTVLPSTGEESTLLLTALGAALLVTLGIFFKKSYR